MKAKDLMIGDWVYNTHNRKAEQVAEIGSGLVMLDYNDLCEYDEIEPIPLTQAALAANFGKKNNTGLYGISDDYYDFDIYEINDGTYLARYHNCEMSSIPDEQVLVCYVHQLQHFMRHCLIEEDIRL